MYGAYASPRRVVSMNMNRRARPHGPTLRDQTRLVDDLLRLRFPQTRPVWDCQDGLPIKPDPPNHHPWPDQ